jgi:hypothetical protein
MLQVLRGKISALRPHPPDVIWEERGGEGKFEKKEKRTKKRKWKVKNKINAKRQKIKAKRVSKR